MPTEGIPLYVNRRDRARNKRRAGRALIPVENRGKYLLRRGVMRSFIGRKIAPHMFKRFTQNVFSSNAGTTISGVFNTTGTAFNVFDVQFRLGDLPNSAEFTALYDQFMLSKIVIKFIPQRTLAETNNTALSGGFAGCRLLSVIDHDDATNITADGGREYDSCKITPYGVIHKRVIVPSVLRQMYESNIATAYTPAFKQWISTTDPNTIHYGLKGGIIMNDAAATTNSVAYSIEAKYYFKCKNVK